MCGENDPSLCKLLFVFFELKWRDPAVFSWDPPVHKQLSYIVSLSTNGAHLVKSIRESVRVSLISVRSRLLGSEDPLVFAQQQLDGLVLIHHVDGHVSALVLRTHQRGAEHDADVLSRHAIAVGALHHPEQRPMTQRRVNVTVQHIFPTLLLIQRETAQNFHFINRKSKGETNSFLWVTSSRDTKPQEDVSTHHVLHLCSTLMFQQT